jgi:hypothetical protein
MDQIDVSQVTGYAPEDRYLATRYCQGDRNVYDFELPLDVIPQIFTIPDPERPTLGNRRVNPGHAKDFANYVRDHEDWVAPALLMRAPEIFTFDAKNHLAGVSFGILGIPRSSRRDIRIIDGQHRILGLYYAVEDLARDLDETRAAKTHADRDGNPELALVWAKKLEKLERQRQRLSQDHLGVQIQVETDQTRFEQMFFDVADNALGITGAVKVRFDSRKVMHRTLDAVMKHALLRDRVDLEQDRIGGANQNLLGARHVVDIVRSVNIGVSGRVSRRQEAELQEGALVQRALEFFDAIVEAFPDLAAVADGNLAPEDLRKRSLLGSSSMLRVLAGAYEGLLEKGYSDDEITDLYRDMAPFMAAPIQANSPLLKLHSPVFLPGASAPTSRAQDLRSLTDEIIGWIDPEDRPSWLART